MSLPLILLKTESSPSDPYLDFFRANPLAGASVRPVFVPVLQHAHVNIDALKDLLPRYAALIVTSQRAVEVLARVSPLPTGKPVYVVGAATGAAVAALGFMDVRGAQCGNGAALAEFILGEHAGKEPLLFPVGEVRRDVIPRRLGENGIQVRELVVYETKVVEGFEGDLRRVLDGLRRRRKVVVVFSPTGADTTVNMLGNGGEEDAVLAAIGPTTEEQLVGLGRKPEVVAANPSPEGLWSALEEYLKRADRGAGGTS